MARYERIVFFQGDDADEWLELLDDQGEQPVVDALMEWHHPGEHV